MRTLHVGLHDELDSGQWTVTPGGFNHLVIQVEALHDTVARLAALGIEAEEPSSPSGSEDFWTTRLTDPHGYRIELVRWSLGHSDGLTPADFQNNRRQRREAAEGPSYPDE